MDTPANAANYEYLKANMTPDIKVIFDELRAAANFIVTHQDIIKQTQLLFNGDLSNKGIVKIANNLELFNYYNTPLDNTKRFIYKGAALEYADRQDHPITVYFAELDLYAVYNSTDYELFTKELERVKNGVPKSITLRQLVLSTDKQKLVFACSNINLRDKLADYTLKYFKVHPHVNNNELTVGIECANFAEARQKYDDLSNYLIRTDKPYFDIMKPQDLQQDAGFKYIEQSINYKSDLTAAMLRNPDSISQLFRCINFTGNGHTIFNGPVTINIINQPKSSKEIAREWIIANPPTIEEKTKMYYDRYAKVNEQRLYHIQFGTIVREVGYTMKHGTGTMKYWSK